MTTTPEKQVAQLGPDGEQPFEATLRGLRDRRDAGERFPSAARGALSLAGAQLLDADLAGLDLSGVDLSGAELSGADLTGARLISCNLAGAILHGSKLDDAELMAADLSGANLSDATACRAGLGKAKLVGLQAFGASFQGATLSGADLAGADLSTADLRGARLVAAALTATVLLNADLREADLTDCRVDEAVMRGADLRAARVRGVRGYQTADWVNTDVRDVDFCGAWLLRRHVLDENFIHEFRNQSPGHEWVYKVWWASSDCGRSIFRWGAWTVLVAVIYGLLFMMVDVDYGSHETFLSPLYYSVVTFTTLGYGDVLPASAAAQVMAVSEVVLGYVSLGGLLSIMANKLARRAD